LTVHLKGSRLFSSKFNVVATLLPVALLLLPVSATAALGGDATSLQSDLAHMKASLRTSPGAKFTVHEMTLPYGTTVREYMSPQGAVFAVTWKGPVKPDLRQLMGNYFDQYLQAAPNTRGAHSAAVLMQPNLVVRSTGHMRAFSGHAYLPQLMPAGVSAADLR
jgi:hypothetical protein